MSDKREPSGEDRRIERFFRPLARHPGALDLKDDAAFLSPASGFDLVLTADSTVAGVHFFSEDPADFIAKKSLRVNLSDLSAKGAEPIGALLAVSFPEDVAEEWIERFARGLGEDCAAFKCPLLGGDTTQTPGPLSISITAVGQVPSGKMVRRAGAKPGDFIVVSGTIGDAALGLKLKQRLLSGGFGELSEDQTQHLRQRYLLPEPRTPLAPILMKYAHAAMDISDGLVGDLAKLCAVSGVRGQIEALELPLSSAAHDALAAEPALIETIMTGGDDYEVLAAISQDDYARFSEEAGQAGVPVSAIGTFAEGKGVFVRGSDGLELSFKQASYSHF